MVSMMDTETTMTPTHVRIEHQFHSGPMVWNKGPEDMTLAPRREDSSSRKPIARLAKPERGLEHAGSTGEDSG